MVAILHTMFRFSEVTLVLQKVVYIGVSALVTLFNGLQI